MGRPDDELTIRSYRVCFALERRIHQVDRWRIPAPYGVPLRGSPTRRSRSLAVLVLQRLPVAGELLGVLHPALRFVILPVGVAYAAAPAARRRAPGARRRAGVASLAGAAASRGGVSQGRAAGCAAARRPGGVCRRARRPLPRLCRARAGAADAALPAHARAAAAAGSSLSRAAAIRCGGAGGSVWASASWCGCDEAAAPLRLPQPRLRARPRRRLGALPARDALLRRADARRQARAAVRPGGVRVHGRGRLLAAARDARRGRPTATARAVGAARLAPRPPRAARRPPRGPRARAGRGPAGQRPRSTCRCASPPPGPSGPGLAAGARRSRPPAAARRCATRRRCRSGAWRRCSSAEARCSSGASATSSTASAPRAHELQWLDPARLLPRRRRPDGRRARSRPQALVVDAPEGRGGLLFRPLEADLLRLFDCPIEVGPRGRCAIESEAGDSPPGAAVPRGAARGGAVPGRARPSCCSRRSRRSTSRSTPRFTRAMCQTTSAVRLVRRRIVDADNIYAEEAQRRPRPDRRRRPPAAGRARARGLPDRGRAPAAAARLALAVRLGAARETELEERVERLRREYGSIELHRPLGDQLRAVLLAPARPGRGRAPTTTTT